MKLETVGSNSDIKNQMTIDGMYIYLESKIGVRKSEGYGNRNKSVGEMKFWSQFFTPLSKN